MAPTLPPPLAEPSVTRTVSVEPRQSLPLLEPWRVQVTVSVGAVTLPLFTRTAAVAEMGATVTAPALLTVNVVLVVPVTISCSAGALVIDTVKFCARASRGKAPHAYRATTSRARTTSARR